MQALHLGRTGAVQREAALMTRVDHLPRRSGGCDQDSEQADWKLALEGLDGYGGDRRPRDTVAAIAGGDEVTVQLFLVAVVAEGHSRMGGVEIVQLYVVGLENNLPAGCNGRRN
jgi:hypothetical protein